MVAFPLCTRTKGNCPEKPLSEVFQDSFPEKSNLHISKMQRRNLCLNFVKS